MGYKFQFVTLAGFHSLNAGMFELARDYARSGMTRTRGCRSGSSPWRRSDGYSAIRHQRFVGTGYFDAVQMTIAGGRAATTALEGSTERAQFGQALPQAASGPVSAGQGGPQ